MSFAIRTNFASPTAQNAYNSWLNESQKLASWEKENRGPERDESIHQAWIQKVQAMEKDFHTIDASEVKKNEEAQQKNSNSIDNNKNIGKNLNLMA